MQEQSHWLAHAGTPHTHVLTLTRARLLHTCAHVHTHAHTLSLTEDDTRTYCWPRRLAVRSLASAPVAPTALALSVPAGPSRLLRARPPSLTPRGRAGAAALQARPQGARRRSVQDRCPSGQVARREAAVLRAPGALRGQTRRRPGSYERAGGGHGGKWVRTTRTER